MGQKYQVVLHSMRNVRKLERAADNRSLTVTYYEKEDFFSNVSNRSTDQKQMKRIQEICLNISKNKEFENIPGIETGS
jgi:hypothetical protein